MAEISFLAFSSVAKVKICETLGGALVSMSKLASLAAPVKVWMRRYKSYVLWQTQHAFLNTVSSK